MEKFSQDKYLKDRIKEIYKGRPCNLMVMNGELFKRDSNGALTQIFVDPNKYLDKIEEKFWKEEDKQERIKIQKVKKAALKGAIAVGAAIYLGACLVGASKVGKQGIENNKKRFSQDSSYSQTYEGEGRGR